MGDSQSSHSFSLQTDEYPSEGENIDSTPVSSSNTDVYRRLSPMPSPQILHKSRNIYRARFDFEGYEALNNDYPPLRKGDRLDIDVERQMIDNWWMGTNLRTGKKGYVPVSYICRDDDIQQSQEWWFDVSERDTELLLLSPEVRLGNFLIRDTLIKEALELNVRDESTVEHYLIRRQDNGAYYISPYIFFDTIEELIRHYSVKCDGLCTQLTDICPRTPPDPPIPYFSDVDVGCDLITMTTQIGVGHFGEVWKGKLHNNIDVAVKKLKRGTMSPESFLAEARILHQLRHKNLVELVAVCSKQEPILIVTELMANSSLLDYLRKDDGKEVTFRTITDMASQIAEAMAFLEAREFIHQNLRAANILVSQNLNLKVADSGLARILINEEATEETEFLLKWTAPEAATYRKFSIKSDVWSFGIVMYEMITFGKIPYPGMTGAEVLQEFERGYRMPRPFSPVIYKNSYYEVMLQCWDKSPCDRPTFAYLRQLFDDFDRNSVTVRRTRLPFMHV